MNNQLSSKNEDLKLNLIEVNLAKYTTMKIGGKAKFFAMAHSEKDVMTLHKKAKELNLEMFPLGEGSNTIFVDNSTTRENILDKYLFVLIKNKGILKTYDGPNMTNVEVQAGENWDDLVKWSVENNLSGLECLSGIPGTVGAGPIQNIGAYGSEIKDTLSQVKILEIESGEIFEIPNSECDFSYRNSIFKQNLGKFVILSVSFTLSKNHKNLKIPQYNDVQLYFLEKKQKQASVAEIRKAILEIRSKKIPWPKEIPNTGSFFKNPIIENTLAGKIARENPEIPYFKVDENHAKLYAGWLIEKCDFKGFNFGKIKIHENNALVITNPKGSANFSDLEKAINQIQAAVFNKFEVDLEVEPNIIK